MCRCRVLPRFVVVDIVGKRIHHVRGRTGPVVMQRVTIQERRYLLGPFVWQDGQAAEKMPEVGHWIGDANVVDVPEAQSRRMVGIDPVAEPRPDPTRFTFELLPGDMGFEPADAE